MTELLAVRDDQPDLTIFKCRWCDLSYFTDDHVAVTGLPRRPFVTPAPVPEVVSPAQADSDTAEIVR